MRRAELGFTLVETVVAVAIVLVLLVAGGVWALSDHSGSLRAALDDYDAALASARAIAASSGSGATLVFAPRTDPQGNALAGFALRVYRGRPNAANAVTPTTVFAVVSDATVSERLLGTPVFSIFLSSGGYASGVAHYPTIANDGSATFPVLAQQPPCPNGNFVLTFSTPQGNASATRTLSCRPGAIAGTGTPQASPTPNAPVVAPAALVADFVTGAPTLHFVAAEFGYTHWFASAAANNATCGTSVARYPSGSPYSAPFTAAEGQAPPPPPVGSAFSYPNTTGGSMNDAPALFLLQPVTAGVCTATVVDAFGQTASATVQVKGDLTLLSALPSPPTVTFTSTNAPAQTLTFGKTFDGDALRLRTGGNCNQLIGSPTATVLTTPATPSNTPATAALTLQPIANSSGSCTLLVGDQYGGSPAISINVVVQSAPLSVVPAAIEFPASANGTIPYPSLPIAFAPPALDARIARYINALLGGGIASAASTPSVGTPCSALAFTDATYTTLDAAHDANLGTQGGCYTATGLSALGFPSANADVQASEPGFMGTFTPNLGPCASRLHFIRTNAIGTSTSNLGFQQSSGSATGTCTFMVASSAGIGSQSKPVTAKFSANDCSVALQCIGNFAYEAFSPGMDFQQGDPPFQVIESSLTDANGHTVTPAFGGTFAFTDAQGNLLPPVAAASSVLAQIGEQGVLPAGALLPSSAVSPAVQSCFANVGSQLQTDIMLNENSIDPGAAWSINAQLLFSGYIVAVPANSPFATGVFIPTVAC